MKMMIDGQKTESGDGKTIPVINPITNEVIDTIPMATKNGMWTGRWRLPKED